METKRVYLAGRMTGISFESSNEWRVIAKERLEDFESPYRVIAINPNDYYNFKEVKHETEKEIVRYDLNRVRTSDMILVNLTGDSIGTAMELMLAHELHIPIIGFTFGNKKDIHPWLDYVCDRVFSSLIEAVNYVKEYYLAE